MGPYEGVFQLKFQNSSSMYMATAQKCIKSPHFRLWPPMDDDRLRNLKIPPFTNISGFSFGSIVKMWPALAIIGHFQGKASFQKFWPKSYKIKVDALPDAWS